LSSVLFSAPLYIPTELTSTQPFTPVLLVFTPPGYFLRAVDVCSGDDV
jgi:hypothetical protein